MDRPRPEDSVKFDTRLFNWYKTLISLRNDNKTLSLGSLKFFLINNDKKIIGYSRSLNSKTFFIIINNKNQNDEININLNDFNITRNKLTDLLNKNIIANQEGEYKINLKPYGIVILN
ncbi:MAG: alpha-glucosidase C-terminal domain-containing protein [Ignavibacteriaceae bacterium]